MAHWFMDDAAIIAFVAVIAREFIAPHKNRAAKIVQIISGKAPPLVFDAPGEGHVRDL